MRAFAVAAALSLVACEAADAPPAPPPQQAPAKAPEPRQDLPDEQRSPDLFGAWLVERVEAPDPALQDEGWDTVLLVGSRQLQVLSQCITIGPFDYSRTTGGGISVSQATVTPRRSPPGAPAPVQCARTHSAAERALPGVLLAAREVTVNDGRVTLSGPSGRMILRRPSGALGNPGGEAPPPRVPPLIGAWNFVAINDRTLPANERAELLLSPNRLEWRSGCVNEAREARIDRDVLHPGEIDPFPVCERGRSDAEQALERLFGSAVVTRMKADGQLSLSGSGVTATLEPLTS